jgi:hypothetical protein
MDNFIYPIAVILFLLSPVVLLLGLIKPALFKRIIKGQPRRLPVILYALALFAVSLTLAGIFEPDSVKHDQAVRQQLAAQQSQQAPEAAKQTVSQVSAAPQQKAKTAEQTAPSITALQKSQNGYQVTGRGTAGQTIEVRTVDHKKYQATVASDGSFHTTIKSLKPYGTLSLFGLKKSFMHTKADYLQTKYYSLFSPAPKLSGNKLNAVITAASKDGGSFKLQGFYLPKSALELTYQNKTIAKVSTNKDGYFAFSSLKAQADTMQLALEADNAAVASTYIYTPKLALLATAPIIKTEQQTENIPFGSSTQNDASITKGATRVSVAGKNGVKTLTYQVTYIDGKEVGRKLVSNAVTVQPVNEVKKLGTYVAPAYVPPAPTPAATVPSSGATAQCRDGTPSYSQHRSGTCSHHGGVAVWY